MKKPSNYLLVKNELFLLYLKGIRGIFEKKSKQRRYFFYQKIILLGSTLLLYTQTKQFLQFEYYQRKQPNSLIPKFIYKARREHYIYWETSRLARGKSTIFTHYEWDKQSQMIYYIARDGKQKFEKNLFSRERLDIANNPLFEKIMRAEQLTPKLNKLGNKLIAYNLNLFNKYDLDNYLQYKSITISDFVRAVYYKIWLGFYISNKYRYEHFISKPDFLYDFEKIKIALDPVSKDQSVYPQNNLKVFQFLNQSLIKILRQQNQNNV